MKNLSLTKKVLLGILGIIILFFIIMSFIQPSQNRDWKTDLEILPECIVDDDQITILNIRNISYNVDGMNTISYYNQTYNLAQIKSTWLLVEPFSAWEAAAHTLLSFEFENNTFIAVSVEARMEENEEFGAVKGLLKNFELMYVWGDEKDLIARRGIWLNHPLYLYRIEVPKQASRELFLQMTRESNAILKKPKHYNTITDTCTTKLAQAANKVTPWLVPWWDYEQYLPGLSAEYLYEKMLLNTTINFQELKIKSNITQKAIDCYHNQVFQEYGTCLRD